MVKMMNNGIIGKIRDLIAAAVVIFSITSGTILVGPETLDAQEVRIAAFNIQVFGKTKRSNTEVMDILVDIFQNFDIVVVQEIRDASEETADIFLDALNESSEFTYDMIEGPRIGRSSSKEQYAIFYVPALVQIEHAYTLPDDDDIFEREPLVVTFKAGNFDFTIVVCHVKPNDAENEIIALAEIPPVLLEANPLENDIIILGDLNADGTYLDEETLTSIFAPDDYKILITNDMDTMTKTDNTYDRIIITQGTYDYEYIEDSAGVFEFDWVLGIDDEELVYDVSDHYPVYAEFDITLPDDD
jgi:deoxyribonuclease-1-like protein